VKDRCVELGVGLGDDVLFLLVSGQVGDLVGDPSVDHLAVGVSMKPYSLTRA
jgi:hypothetical protein